MDWNYILSLSPDELDDEDKDALLNTIAWYDFHAEPEELDLNKSIVLLRLSQEIMKHKSEQVEALNAELDEVATRQGEEEMRKQESEFDAKSLRSRKSSSLENDDLEEKYKSTIAKLKQQTKNNDKLKKELEQLKQRIHTLEQEQVHLQNELQTLQQQDDSKSDISETMKDQHKELIDTVRQKNKQISQMLTDIEVTEAENITLKAKLAEVCDELKDATKQLNKLTGDLTASNLHLEEKEELIINLTQETEALRTEIQELDDAKKLHERQIEEFALEIDSRVDDWKKILDEKNDEIKELKAGLLQTQPSKSLSGGSDDTEQVSQVAILNKILNERDDKIFELQAQLQGATRDMEECTGLLNRLTTQRDSDGEKIEKLNYLTKELKAQLKTTHGRCQELQQEVKWAESLSQKKDKDLNDVLNKLRENGDIGLAETLSKMQDLKMHKRLKDKQISDLVRSCNKLQSSFDEIEKENLEFRARLGISEDETIFTVGTFSRQRKLRKELQQLQTKTDKLEEEKINFRFEIQRLHRIVSNLSRQLVNLGERPELDAEVGETEEKSAKDGMETDSGVSVSRSQHTAVVEENEALRKGMHEILRSLQERSESAKREIKCETLEQLLRALDVKHLSGWYHPAMRLQAELHVLQGGNAELREQLRLARLELNNYGSETTKTSVQNVGENRPTLEKPRILTSSNVELILNLNMHLVKVLEENRILDEANCKLSEKAEKQKTYFDLTEKQVNKLYRQYADDKAIWEKEKESLSKVTHEVQEKVEILEVKLQEISKFASAGNNDTAKLKQISELSSNVVVLNRKCLFLENETTKVRTDLKSAKNDLLSAEKATMAEIKKLCEERNSLKNKITVIETKLKNSTDLQNHIKIQQSFDNLTLKHRELLATFNEIRVQRIDEISILKASIDTLTNDKKVILNKLHGSIIKLNTFEVSTFEIDKATEILSKKLAQSEINEISERQRANHTNNLYELVKEQLRKSEERFKEFENYNKEIMHKNLSLQENIKQLQDKVLNNVDVNEFEESKNRCVELLESSQKLQLENGSLRRDLDCLNETYKTQKLWSSSQEYELLSLKHQVLDLQAVTDDKAVIARLSSDVIHARLTESETRQKLEKVSLQLKNLGSQYEELTHSKEEDALKSRDLVVNLKTKIGMLEEIIKQQREQYFGYIPLTCERKFVDNVAQVYKDKHATFFSLQDAQNTEAECAVLKEQLREQLKVIDEVRSLLKNDDFNAKINKWYNEKCIVQLQELKYRRKAEFVDSQLQQALKRISIHDEQMSKLEEELLLAYQKPDLVLLDTVGSVTLQPNEKDFSESLDKDLECKVKLYKSEQTQTIFDTTKAQSDSDPDVSLGILQVELINTQKELAAKEEAIEQLKSKITELEMDISLFRKQLGDKQSQIMFYEKHILELKSQKEVSSETRVTEEADTGQEVVGLKATIAKLQATLGQKEESIFKYEFLLKKDRDEHSLAAARMQEELRRLQSVLSTQQRAFQELQEGQKEEHPNKAAAIEQYIKQVHTLDKHTSELHTSVSTLESQLQASRQECVRWRTLANDRLAGIDQLREELEETHQNELEVYQNECEKWRQEVVNLKLFLSKRLADKGDNVADLQRIIGEKDEKIQEISVTLRQTRNEMKKKAEVVDSPKVTELQAAKEQLIKEHENLKKRFEQLMNREKNAREEIRGLKGQLMKRPAMSARTEKNDTVKENLQKKVTNLEKEVEELRDNLQRQLQINETHRTKVSEDFEKWSKQKYWQQTAEKLKTKLKEKSDECDKAQQTCSGYRILIERLEREKHTLENRMKSVKDSSGNVSNVKIEILQIENAKLQAEFEALNSKLEMQQHHSGRLGAAMLQEKLTGQERKIAILELSAKGTGELRAEMERLQATNASLQKTNLRMEAENLDLKLDLEKSAEELPHLREQVQHLENYVEVLKAENSNTHQVTSSGDHQTPRADSKKIYELERTVFVLKRIVEKLQAENKRLNCGGKPCINASDRLVPDERLRRDFYRLKEQYGDSVQKIARLEEDLNTANNKMKIFKNRSASDNMAVLSDELFNVRAQLSQKSELLDKVKVLLHRAAAKEKSLLEEISRLRACVPSSTVSPASLKL